MSTQLIAHLKKKCEADDNVKILLSQWEFDQKLVGKALENIGGFYPHFSNHNASHSQQILVNIERILGKDIELLSGTDTWLILEAAYWHDIGMLVDAKSAKEVHEKEEFKLMVKTIAQDKSHDLYQFCAAYKNNDWIAAIGSEDHPFDGVEKYRQLIAEWFRRNHDKRIGGLVEDPFKFLNITSPRTELLPKRIYRYLGQICMSHGMNFSDVMSKLPFKQTGLGTEDCHPRFVGCLLRLGDLFDLDDNRFCPVMAKHVSHQPKTSKAHEDKHLSLREFQLDRRTVKLVAECPDEMSYIETQNWFGWIREEFQNQMSQWNLIVPNSKFTSLPTIEQLEVRMEVKYEEGIKKEKILLDHKPMKFSLDEKKGMELLQGANLYKDEFSIYRELIQNAIDATMLRIWLEEDRDEIIKLHPYHPDFIKICKKYPIKIGVEIIERNDLAKDAIWEIVIKDNGIGISLNDLKYMQKMAGSSRNHKKKKLISEMPIWMRPSGEFGIGLHSAFLLCKDLSVKDQIVKLSTMNYFSNEKLYVEMNSPLGSKNGYCFITKLEHKKREIGTEIKIKFKNKYKFNILKLSERTEDDLEQKKINFYRDLIYKKLLSHSSFSKSESNDYQWDSVKNIAYKFSLNSEGHSVRFRGQTAEFESRHERMIFNDVIDFDIDYYGMNASESLNISRDLWHKNFILEVSNDKKRLLRNSIEENASVLNKFLDKIYGLDIYKCDDWKCYEYHFDKGVLSFGEIINGSNIFMEAELYEFLKNKEGFDGNIFVTNYKDIMVLESFFMSQRKTGLLNNCKIFELDKGHLLDREVNGEIFGSSYFISSKNELPPERIGNLELEWIEYKFRPDKNEDTGLLVWLRRISDLSKDSMARKHLSLRPNLIRSIKACEDYFLLCHVNNLEEKMIISPIQLNETELYLLDLNDLVSFIWSERLPEYKDRTIEEFKEMLDNLILEIKTIISENNLEGFPDI